MKHTYKKQAWYLDEDVLLEGYIDKYGFHPADHIECGFSLQRLRKLDRNRIYFYDLTKATETYPAAVIIPKRKYYEIELDRDPRSRECTDELIGECSICIIGTRKPTYEEAEAFCREEMMAAGYEYIVAIREISHEDALDYIHAADEQKLPIFGLQI